ncbi:MAG: hypothetical protein U1F08_09385 [Steroidobacteraceae bacterium]
MNRHPKLVPLVVAAIATAVVALPSAPADAATKRKPSGKAPPATEAVYRCRDANGRYVMGQSIPPICMDQDVEVLDVSGRVVRVIPGRDSLAAAERTKAAEDARIAAVQRDKTLLATYLSVADIERLRDQRLDLLVQQAHVTEQYISNLREREKRLTQDVRRFRPYSDKASAPPLPEHIAEEIVNTVNGLQVYQEELGKNTAEQTRLRAEFNADIARFRQLKAVN